MTERPQNKNLKRGGPGRPKGIRNKRTEEIAEMAQRLVCDPIYRDNLQARLREGKAPHMETLLHHYAFGKPVERVEVSGADGEPLQIYLTWDSYAGDETQNGQDSPAALTSGSA